MKRIQSVDMIRGLCLFVMVLYHSVDWWILIPDRWIIALLVPIIGPLIFTGFLFVSGISGIISYRKGIIMAEKSDTFTIQMVKNSFILRALIIILIALIYNTIFAIVLMNPLFIWTWFVLLTIGISLLLSVPFLNTSKITRICVSGALWIVNHLLFSFLTVYAGQLNFFGIMYHIFYNSPEQDVILGFFPFLLYGTVVGDILFEISNIENPIERKSDIRNKLLIPSLIIGAILIIFGLWFWYPNFDVKVLTHPTSFYWAIFSCGIQLVIFSIGIYIEEFVKTKRSYRFLFYFSYYSLTIYLAHYLLFFIPLHQKLNAINFWYFFIPVFIIIGFILRGLFKKYKAKIALKTLIGVISMILTLKAEKKKRNLSKASIKVLKKIYYGNISKK